MTRTRAFLGHRTFSAKIRNVLGKMRWLVTPHSSRDSGGSTRGLSPLSAPRELGHTSFIKGREQQPSCALIGPAVQNAESACADIRYPLGTRKDQGAW